MVTCELRSLRGPRRRILTGVVMLLTAGATVAFASPAAADASDGSTHTIFATREGLVGRTTANGHVITENDHFVALPSTSALSADGTGAYSVRVCAPSTGRCEYAPVWDVGPWNIGDDYWSTTRHFATDLPVGTPQASAAFRLGYAGGLDGFGRQVLNPAGIDLADGTFLQGLRLTSNAWIKVTYLWQGNAPKGTIDSPVQPLTVRSGPGTGYRAVGLAANTAQVPLTCHLRGTTVTGTRGTTNLWYRIGPRNWVSDAYVITGTGEPVAPRC
ncbi:hypothetical protein [Xylanimonas protaetiae]|uniref:SH3 domain-containing protein n=1 Tax=Xylanimonas protaetiae TaxID=2509457 RepID=A0A4P6F4J0_9MICO|nr:hypothetical protein [Xylanimonas protaetiae]QAY70562.1 hypothetical protein ET471_11415 [Xylanimonas protaetiae]